MTLFFSKKLNKLNRIKKKIFISLLLFAFQFTKTNKNVIYNIRKEQNNINKKLIETNNWINICKNKLLIRGLLKSSSKPKITALITLFNSEKYIESSVKSVQNQILCDIEILMVEDGSTDESLNIIKKLQKEDNRIKIIENKKNRGALYSKSIGILKANGKYIMILDSDDLFAKLLKIIYLKQFLLFSLIYDS